MRHFKFGLNFVIVPRSQRESIQSANEYKTMSDTIEEVAPLTAEAKPEGLISLADIAEASGVNNFFESQNVEEEITDDQQSVSEPEYEPEPEQPELVQEVVQEPEDEINQDSDGVKKRIGKLVEARKLAEAEKELLEKRVAELEGKRAEYKDVGMDRLSEIITLEEADKREQDAEHLRDWLLENPNGGDYQDLQGNEHEVESQMARKLMVETDRDLRKNIPKVRNQIQVKAQQREIAKNTFGWMKDNHSPENVELQTILKNNPHLSKYFNSDPYGDLAIGYMVEGVKAINARKQQSQKVAQAPKVPSAPNRKSPSVVRGKPRTDKEGLLAKASSGNIEDASSYIESIL